MSENSIKGIMDVTMEKLRAMVDADTIIGTPIKLGEVTLLPVSKITFGVATGGSDNPSKTRNDMFGGGGGAGVTISPVAFISISGDSVKMMPIYNDLGTVDKAVNMAPELLDKIKGLFSKNDKTELQG